MDESGCFPLAALVEKRAREQLADVSLLCSSVEYALHDAAKEIVMLKRELDAAKCWDFLLCSSISVPPCSSVFQPEEWFPLVGDSTSCAGLERQLAASVPLAVLNDKLKEKDDTHASIMSDLQAAMNVSEKVERL